MAIDPKTLKALEIQPRTGKSEYQTSKIEVKEGKCSPKSRICELR